MKIDARKYHIQKLPNLMLLHWILNPGLAFNECILGQRIPKIILTDKTSNAPLMERQYIPCEKCNALNDARLWSKSGFGNWFGLVCPVCGGKIPCLWNLTSIVLLAVTFPLWIWIKIFFQEKILQRQRNQLAANANSPLPTVKKIKWLRMGMLFGFTMFVLSILEIPKSELSGSRMISSSIAWTIGGLAFGFAMKLYLSWKK